MIDQNSSLPLYQQISESIAADILNGKYKAGEKLPGELLLCKKLGVSRVTLRHAIADLVDSGLVVSKQGKGTYVSTSRTVIEFAKKKFQVREHYNVPGKTTEVIESGELIPDDDLREFVKAEAGKKYPYVVRLRHVNSKPAIVEVDFFNEKSSDAMAYDISNRSLLSVIREDLGIKVDSFDDCIRIIPASGKISEVLKVPDGKPLIRVSEVVRDKDGDIIYFNDQIINSDIYNYHVWYGYAD